MFNVKLVVATNNGLIKVDYTGKDINEVKKNTKKELTKMNLTKESKHTYWWKHENSKTFIPASLGDIEYCIGRELI
jgi:histidinol phosphatase-like enzyme